MGSIVSGALLLSCGDSGEDGSRSDSSASPAGSQEAASVVDAPDCASVARWTVDQIQRHVDQFSDDRLDALDDTVERGQGPLEEAAAEARERMRQLDCEPADVRRMLEHEMERLRGEGPVADGVAATFRSVFLGSQDPSDTGAVHVTVDDADGLVSAVASAGSGSTIELAPGEYRLEQPLALFRPVAIVGSGDAVPTIVSSADGAAILSLADGEVELQDVAVRHEGESPASVVVVRSGRVRLDGADISGGRQGADGGGFGVLLRSADDGARSHIVDSTIRANAGGGIVVAGTDAPVVAEAILEGNGVCAVCYFQSGGGSLDGLEVRGSPIGVHVGDRSAPTIGGGSIGADEVGVVFAGEARGSVEGTTVSGGRIGLQVEGEAAPRLRTLSFAGVGEAAIVLTGNSAADVAEVTCAGAIVLLLEATDPQLGGGISCPVVDGRT